jgi:hypothetical protein
MNTRTPLSPAGKLTVPGLVVAATGIVILDVSGIPFPRIPPGLVILLASAALVGFAPWRWVPAVGAGVGLFLTVGFVVSGAVSYLVDSGRPGVLAGAWVELLGVLTALVAGVVATTQHYLARTPVLSG